MTRSVFVFVFVLACSRTDKVDATAPAPKRAPPAARAPAPAPKQAPAPAPAPQGSERERAEQLYGEAVQRHGGYVAMAKNTGDQRSTMKRFELGLDVFSAKVRFPPEPDTAGLEAVLRALAAKAGFGVESVSLTPRNETRPTRPELVPDGTRLELVDADIRGTLDVALVLKTAPTDAAAAKLAKETIDLPRFVLWTKAAPTSVGGAPALKLEGEAYWFYPDVRVPRVDHKTPSLTDALAKHGLPGKPSDPAAAEAIRKATKLFDEMAALRKQYDEMLALIRETVLLRRRFAFTRERRAEQDAAAQRLKLPVSAVP